jgi:hypothetical protein
MILLILSCFTAGAAVESKEAHAHLNGKVQMGILHFEKIICLISKCVQLWVLCDKCSLFRRSDLSSESGAG